jgi:phospholipase C
MIARGSVSLRAALGRVALLAILAMPACAPGQSSDPPSAIQHLVVIFQENVSFDHYFATYPHAANPSDEPAFTASLGTPTVDGLDTALLTHNPNAAQPQRLDRSQAITCDQDHGYRHEQMAFDMGKMDKFVQSDVKTKCPDPGLFTLTDNKQNDIVMDYYDGNTVTALWTYAQHFAMSDHFFGTTFGPSTVGALNLVAGQTYGATSTDPTADGSPDAAVVANGTVIGDPPPDPALDACSSNSSGSIQVRMSGKNVGDLLNAKDITWGWFQGGFRPSSPPSPSSGGSPVVCGTSHRNIGGVSVTDYLPHHEPFQYYPSTANPRHLPPSSVALIGHSDQANHQYDLGDFWAAVDAGHMPAVSYLKAAAYQDGHARYSDPLDEQTFLVETINHLQQLSEWSSMAILIAYDDSDGWYDHMASPNVSHSSDDQHDYLYGTGLCKSSTPASDTHQDRCGYGPRLPLLLISPFAKRNFVDHTVTDQSSILRFIEDNWSLGRIGDQSFDAAAGSLANLFDLSGTHPITGKLTLWPDSGEPA